MKCYSAVVLKLQAKPPNGLSLSRGTFPNRLEDNGVVPQGDVYSLILLFNKHNDIVLHC